jgi:hypothetical protein
MSSPFFSPEHPRQPEKAETSRQMRRGKLWFEQTHWFRTSCWASGFFSSDIFEST